MTQRTFQQPYLSFAIKVALKKEARFNEDSSSFVRRALFPPPHKPHPYWLALLGSIISCHQAVCEQTVALVCISRTAEPLHFFEQGFLYPFVSRLALSFSPLSALCPTECCSTLAEMLWLRQHLPPGASRSLSPIHPECFCVSAHQRCCP